MGNACHDGNRRIAHGSVTLGRFQGCTHERWQRNTNFAAGDQPFSSRVPKNELTVRQMTANVQLSRLKETST